MDTKTRRLRISGGKYVLVDNSDYDTLARLPWFVQKGYACRYARHDEPGGRGEGRHTPRLIFMHRVIMGNDLAAAGIGAEVDHRNGKRRDNRRSNLRVTNRLGNGRNKGPRKGKRFKGISLCPNGRWIARLNLGGKRLNLGTYSTPVAAAQAYDRAASEHHGAYARLNFGGVPSIS